MRITDETSNINFSVLIKTLLNKMPKSGNYPTPIPGLALHRREVAYKPENCFNTPILAMTVQGAKRTVVGNKEFRYGAGYSLLAGIDMPSMSYLTEASPEKPYLVITLSLDNHLTSLLAAQLPSTSSRRVEGGAVVMKTEQELVHAFNRLIELLDKPDQLPLLAPVIIKEIHLHLLMGPYGGVLKSINTQGTKSHRMLETIHWMRDNFKYPLNVDKLSSTAHMASSTFRKNFKTITTMSPTEYHKQLRLYEAQRLMLEEGSDVSQACYQVGYKALTQFNREYKQLFGSSPRRSVENLD